MPSPSQSATTVSPPSTAAVADIIAPNWTALQVKVKKQTAPGLSSSINQGAQNNSADKSGASLWFDVDQVALRKSCNESLVASGGKVSIIDLFPQADSSSKKDVKRNGKYVAMDCEFVGVGMEGKDHALARVSLVNYHGQVLLDSYCRPKERIVDFRTAISGVKAEDVRDAPRFEEVQKQVAEMLEGKIIVGHGLANDFAVLMLSHPRKLIRDTSKLRKFRALSHGKTPALRKLCQEVLGFPIQTGAHDSVDDARVAMLLYRSCKDEWENGLFRQEGKMHKAAKRVKRQQLKKRKREKASQNDSEAFLNNLIYTLPASHQ